MRAKIIENPSGWELRVEDRPFFVRGAVGHERLERLAALGANAVRLPRVTRERLDAAQAAGLGVLAGLPLKPERNGMDYDDVAAVEAQRERVLDLVREFKDHPAVLMWCAGNELDHIPGRTDFNPKVWDAVNAIARGIHEMDADHPVLTAVGMGEFGKIAGCVAACPELDLLGVNAYADVGRVAPLLREHGWTKPYLITEWGMSGAWQRPKTPWGAPFEETSTVKAECYRRRYRSAVLAHPGRCLGSFIFYWGWRHETTLSWYNTWDPEGNEMETVEVWRELWTGEPADPTLPHLYGVRVNHFAAPDPVWLRPGDTVPLEALTDGSAGRPGLRFRWELRPEVEYGAYAGGGETLPEVVAGAIRDEDGPRASLRAPETTGRFRVFVYLYDHDNRFATANLPVFIGEPE